MYLPCCCCLYSDCENSALTQSGQEVGVTWVCPINDNMGMVYNNTVIAMHNYYSITVEVKNVMNDNRQ